MSFGGFGKSSGPTAPLKAQPTFGYFSQPPSPPLSNPPFPTPSAPTRSPSPRTFSPYEGSRPPSPFDNSRLATGPPRPAAGPPRASVAPIRAASLRWDRQSSLAGDVKGPIQKKFPSAGPRDHGTSISSKAISLQDLDRTRSPPVQYADDFLDSDNDGKEGGAPLQWGDRQSSFTRYVGGPIQKRSPSPGLHGGGTSTSSKVYQFQGPDRSRPPPVQYTDDFLNYDSDGKEGAATLGWGDRQSSLAGDDGGPIRKRSALSGPRDLGTSISSRGYRFQEPERTRSPPVQYTDDILNPDTDGEDGISTDVLGMTKIQYNQRSSASADGMNGGNNVNKVVSHTVSKRNRSPPASATGQILLTHIHSSEDDAERELQAKAKRLARFKTELVETEPIDSTKFAPNVPRKKISLAKADQEKKKSSLDYPSRLMEDSSQDFDNEDMQSCSVIVGLCPDMCPESERAERERKGDLDKYERLDGDRNQTSKTLAVKKYNRTAEREAELIRPMPILQKTMAYLLGLLDQPYDDRFLGLYNFLWDRMRAIRMDLRMQHIFNLEAITMLEQMIRLHVVAMHELCEFSKGEGFSEGFDAHLNIEQMNKTSVELFQLYDDHRKRGILIPTEKEFRGYYALLKLDKHPGYKVEPAELSLDLAKMTAKIRQTHEVLFARDVARSCRTGNFIAFFRHARKGSYLQACLMHAHFSKLRTQALASLHSGLQYNQGLPVSHIANWLGMEGEDIESLLEYHGFSIKEYEEPYMVKEGPFLNADKDYPTRCSILVHGKKSKTILEDILSSRQGIPSPCPFKKEAQLAKNEKQATVPPKRTKTPIVSEEAMVMETISSPKDSLRVQSALEKSVSMHAEPILETLIIGQASIQNHPRASISSPKSQIATPNPFASFPSHSVPQQPSPVTPADSLLVLNNDQLNRKSPAPYNVPVPPSVPDAQPPLFEWARETSFGLDRSTPVSSPGVVVHLELKATQPEIVSRNEGQWMPNASEVDYGVASSPQDDAIMEVSREEFLDERQEVTADDDDANYYDQEVAEAKLKLLIRLWKRRSARKRGIREQNRLAADAALSSLSLGPPIRQIKDKSLPYRKLNIDQMVSERYEKLQQSWARWNVSDIVASKLTEKNTNSNCICWKLISYTWLNGGHGDLEARNIVNRLSLDQWLRYKLIPAQEDASASDLVMSGPGLSIWSKWVSDDSNAITCCLSVIKDLESRHYEKKLDGASALLFPLSETLPVEHQKAELHNLVMCLPAGARMPLLILSGFSEAHVEETPGNIIDKLGLDDFDSSRVGSFKIICLKESEGVDRTYGYFNDQKLKEGLIWLASASHPQPVLYNVTMRELVSSHLKTCLDALAMMSSDTTGPNQCISAFNEALDRSINNIVAAASSNPTGWPCPEVFLLDDTTAEFRAVRLFLPSLGWSSSEEVGPLISALRSCKLPSFSYDISWLNRGCSSMQDFESQRQLIQDSLISYLTQSSNVINWMMASRETDVILKRCVRLELHDAEYKLVPNWLHIFRRVINWQLQRISSITRKAYVSEQPQTTSNPLLFEKSDFEASAPYFIDHPSLDEMFEVSCSPIVSKRVKSSPKYFQDRSLVSSIRNASGIPMFNLEEEQNQQSQVQPIYDSDVYMERNDSEVVPKPEKDPDKLSRLLEQCNVLQDDIEKKLSIYF